MNSDIYATKRVLRLEVLERVRAMTDAARMTASAQARHLLTRQGCWQAASSILFYAPMAGELDIWPLLAEAQHGGRTIALPRFLPAKGAYEACVVRDLGSGIRLGHFGIREPWEAGEAEVLNRLDLVLVPGVAFDELGRRLGRGKGYYDRLLGGMKGLKCGVGFDQQIVGEVPVTPRDRPMDCVLTPSRWISL